MKKSVSKWMALLLSVIMIVMCAAGCSKAQTQQPASDHTRAGSRYAGAGRRTGTDRRA